MNGTHPTKIKRSATGNGSLGKPPGFGSGSPDFIRRNPGKGKEKGLCVFYLLADTFSTEQRHKMVHHPEAPFVLKFT